MSGFSPGRPYVGRLAPSPTGALHLGNVRTFMIAWLRARSLGGRVIFRLEDLDHPRDKPGAAAQTVEDLRWLGFDWDEEYVQSERKSIYRDFLNRLLGACPHGGAGDRPRAYPCVCSRKDVENAQSAPHAGEQLHYPGVCRNRFSGWDEAADYLRGQTPLRMPCWRFRVEAGSVVRFEDVFAGPYEQDVAATLGDFPLARDPDGAGYTLACAVDDAEMGVTEVVRGDDLLSATPPQILIQRALGLPTPDYCHVPLVVGPDGKRLAKRHGDTRVAAYRAAGVRPERIVGLLAASCGWVKPGVDVSLADLVPCFSLSAIPHRRVLFTGKDFVSDSARVTVGIAHQESPTGLPPA